jgi:hypothetical protein
MQVCFSAVSRGGLELYITALHLLCLVHVLTLLSSCSYTTHYCSSYLLTKQTCRPKVLDPTIISEITTGKAQEAMELTTDLAVRSRPVSPIIDSTLKSRRHPTPADWQRWRPMIAARYKNVTARMMILEMEAEQLHVT